METSADPLLAVDDVETQPRAPPSPPVALSSIDLRRDLRLAIIESFFANFGAYIGHDIDVEVSAQPGLPIPSTAEPSPSLPAHVDLHLVSNSRSALVALRALAQLPGQHADPLLHAPQKLETELLSTDSSSYTAEVASNLVATLANERSIKCETLSCVPATS
jgi:hypothetical protein